MDSGRSQKLAKISYFNTKLVSRMRSKVDCRMLRCRVAGVVDLLQYYWWYCTYTVALSKISSIYCKNNYLHNHYSSVYNII
jgi:hypothetical protein